MFQSSSWPSGWGVTRPRLGSRIRMDLVIWSKLLLLLIFLLLDFWLDHLICLSIFLIIDLSILQTIYSSSNLSIYLFTFLSIYSYLNISIYFEFYQSIHISSFYIFTVLLPSISWSIHLSIHLSIYISITLSVHQYLYLFAAEFETGLGLSPVLFLFTFGLFKQTNLCNKAM